MPDDVEAVIVGGPIHAGRHKRELVAWAAAHRLRLAALPSGFFTRMLMKLITRHQGVKDQDAKRDYDYTDYGAVRRFAAEVAGLPAAVT